LPVVAPVGTVVDIADPVEFTVNAATGVSLNVMLVAPVKFDPRILTTEPTLPDVVRVFTKGPRPAEKRKMVPQ
jgi:hypothetical protein